MLHCARGACFLLSPGGDPLVAEMVAAGPEAQRPLVDAVVQSLLQRCVHWLHFDSCLPKPAA